MIFHRSPATNGFVGRPRVRKRKRVASGFKKRFPKWHPACVAPAAGRVARIERDHMRWNFYFHFARKYPVTRTGQVESDAGSTTPYKQRDSRQSQSRHELSGAIERRPLLTAQKWCAVLQMRYMLFVSDCQDCLARRVMRLKSIFRLRTLHICSQRV